MTDEKKLIPKSTAPAPHSDVITGLTEVFDASQHVPITDSARKLVFFLISHIIFSITNLIFLFLLKIFDRNRFSFLLIIKNIMILSSSGLSLVLIEVASSRKTRNSL